MSNPVSADPATSSPSTLPSEVDGPDLNDAQRSAVTASLDPQLVVAGPGTGKTRVLVCRAAYLLARFADTLRPSQVAVITFTRKAARQLTARLAELIGPQAQHVRAGTIHQFCSRILDAHTDRLDDVPDDFVVASDAVTDAFWQRWFDDHKGRCKENDLHSFRQVKTRVSQAKMSLESLPGLLQEPLRDYEQMLRSRGAIDFDDLLVKARDLLEAHPEVRRAVRADTRALLVDEFQDTDPVQYRVLRRVGKTGHPRDGSHLFCVADDDQSIYRFRGAEPKNLQKYIDRYACDRDGGTFHVLQKNYRSNRAIYTVAETVLAGRERLKRRGEIETVDPGEDPVEIVPCSTEDAERDHVFATVEHWLEDGTPRRAIGVLAPWNSAVQALEDRFLRAGIACEASSGDPILQEAAVQQLVAMLHMVQRVFDRGAFDGPLEDLLQHVLPEDVFSQVRAFWEQQNAATGATLWGTFQRLARDPEAAASAGLGAYSQHLSRIYAAIGNVLQHARTDEATVGSLAEETLRQLGGSTQMLHDATVSDPREGRGVAAASDRLRAWRTSHVEHGARLLLHDRRERRLQIWRQLVLRGLDLADDPDLSRYTAPALFLASDRETPDPLGADDLVVTADLEAFARWANQYDALDEDDPPHVLCLGPPNVADETLRLAGIDPSRVHPVVPDASRRPTVHLFKLLQSTVAPSAPEPLFREYVMVDLETTSADPDRCRVAEIGAVRIRDGEEVEAFSTLVELPDDVTDDEVRILRDVCDLDPATDFDDAVPLADAWDRFCEIAASCPIVAHNGRQFDFRILDRLADRFAPDEGPPWATTYDTLPTAIELCPSLQRHTAEHLRAHLLDDESDTVHRALDDCRAQVRIFDALQERRAVRQRTGALEPLLPLVVAGLYDEAYATPDEAAFPLADDDRTFLDVGYRWALRDASSVRGVIGRLLPRALPELVRGTPALYDAIDEDKLLRDRSRHPGLSGRIDALFAPYRDTPVRDGLAETLRHLALWRTDDPEQSNDVVTLSTYHSAKGLEFERVICTGVHDSAFPSFRDDTDEDRRESRRLLYVGMTRAEQHLVLTYPEESDKGWDRHRSPFLRNVPNALVTERRPRR